MKTPKQWTKERDFIGGEYDTTKRMEDLIAEVQADARAELLALVATMVGTLEDLGTDPMARIDSRSWARFYRQQAEKVGVEFPKPKDP